MTVAWINENSRALFNAILQLKTEQEVAAFLRDLLTEKELGEFAGRWQVAQSLFSGKPQRQTSQETGVSIATVTRVNQWLRRGMGGYELVLRRLHHTQNLSDVGS